MTAYRTPLILAGALATAVIALASAIAHGPSFVERLSDEAAAARDRAGGQGIAMNFITFRGWLTRHPTLSGGDGMNDATRVRVATAIAQVPGVGGVKWAKGAARPRSTAAIGGATVPLHCQDDVEAILKARSIRFSEASAVIDPASQALLDEVAAALRPCVGSIIAITGHTNTGGDEGANMALSVARANAVLWALVARGIPADGLRATGVGSEVPLERLDPADPANRRIEFSVIATKPLHPTPVDLPAAG